MARPGADYDRVACSTFAADGAARGGVVRRQRRRADSCRGRLTRAGAAAARAGRPAVGPYHGRRRSQRRATEKRQRVPAPRAHTRLDVACCSASPAETHTMRAAPRRAARQCVRNANGAWLASAAPPSRSRLTHTRRLLQVLRRRSTSVRCRAACRGWSCADAARSGVARRVQRSELRVWATQGRLHARLGEPLLRAVPSRNSPPIATNPQQASAAAGAGAGALTSLPRALRLRRPTIFLVTTATMAVVTGALEAARASVSGGGHVAN